MPCLYGSSSGICVTVCMGPFLILTDRAVLLTLVFGQDPTQISLPISWALPTSWAPPIAGLLLASKTEGWA